jgi:branched-chain amino acid transport system substrate-binding protein
MMGIRRFVMRYAALAVVALAIGGAAEGGSLLAACGKVDSGGGDGGVNPAGPPILIGASMGLTGGLSGNTRALQGGLKVAQQQINSLGGILGRQIEFVIKDDASDKTVAPMTIQSLLGQGVRGVIGPGASSEVAVVQGVLASSQIIELSATATSPALTAMQMNRQGWFFRTVPPDSLQGKAVARFAATGPDPDAGIAPCKRMDVLHNDDPYGKSMFPVIKMSFEQAYGGTIVNEYMVPGTLQGSYPVVSQVVTDLPDCMAMVVFADVGDEVVRELRAAIAMDTAHMAAWSKFFIIGTDGCYDPTFITSGRQDPANMNSPLVVEGVYGTNADTNPPTPDYSDLKNMYVAQIGLASDQTDLDAYTSSEYDAAILLALAMQAAQSSTSSVNIRNAMFNVSHGQGMNPTTYGPAKVGEALDALRHGRDINYNGASGPVDFDDSGDVVADYIVWQVQNGQFVTHTRVQSASLQ